jgi:hypothetical protein
LKIIPNYKWGDSIQKKLIFNWAFRYRSLLLLVGERLFSKP